MVALTLERGRGWDAWSLTRRLRAALAALSVVLLLTGVVLVVVLQRADRASAKQTERTFPARRAASQLLTSLVDQETGLRGFALTGDSQFLEPYRQGLIDEQAARADLERYIRPGDATRLALVTVDAAITAWRDQYASLQTAGVNSEGSVSTIRFGKQLFERVRQTFTALDAQLAREVNAAREDADQSRQLVVAVLAVMGVAVAAAVVALQRALQSAVLQPMRTLAHQVDIVSQGKHTTPIRPDGPPDIREMGAGVESMRIELVSALAEIEAQQLGLQRRAAELARSNADLEQFAYVASHDLQEPLRKVASFCQLLEQRYGDQLDERAHQYIAFAVDGARRMQLLINDLLTFSRVGRTSEDFVAVDLAATVTRAWDGLETQVRAAGAELRLDVDPGAGQVLGAPSLIQMLFANLLGNAVKYRRPDATPVVQVSARADVSSVRLHVADNGIGIPEEYAEKVFVIFQRLHGRDEYEGTGIGLALAKKVVEYHGGTIAILPSPLGGACLSFTLPVAEDPADA
ncbi:MAG TPA: ATP-binding protein [Acidimicrobiales bacterium]|nr:ATP-binding protein [Acidimicrobiales bacterium]